MRHKMGAADTALVLCRQSCTSALCNCRAMDSFPFGHNLTFLQSASADSASANTGSALLESPYGWFAAEATDSGALNPREDIVTNLEEVPRQEVEKNVPVPNNIPVPKRPLDQFGRGEYQDEDCYIPEKVVKVAEGDDRADKDRQIADREADDKQNSGSIAEDIEKAQSSSREEDEGDSDEEGEDDSDDALCQNAYRVLKRSINDSLEEFFSDIEIKKPRTSQDAEAGQRHH